MGLFSNFPLAFSTLTSPMASEPSVLLMNHRGDDLAEVVSHLSSRGYQVTVSEGLADTDRLLRDEVHDLLILNPLLPDPQGVELDLAAQVGDEGSAPALVVLVHDPSEADRLRGAWGPDRLALDFILEPFTADELLLRLELVQINADKARALAGRARDLEEQVIADYKTGLYNPRHFDVRLAEEFQRSRRHGAPLAYLLLDIDDFKGINDSTSYAFGDLVLRAVGETVRACVRSIDIPARIGGDEFAVLLPNTTLKEGVRIAGRIRDVLQDLPVETGDHRAIARVSIGVASTETESVDGGQELQDRANEALKAAKRDGKNHVAVPPPPSDEARL